MIDEQFIRDRISRLRQEKQVSERKMSLDLGHSTSYIRSITSGRALPSMGEFLYICEYLGVMPISGRNSHGIFQRREGDHPDTAESHRIHLFHAG